MSSPPGGDRMQSKCEISRATFGNCLKASLYYYYASASASSFLNWIVTLGWVLSSQKSILTLSLSLYNFSGKRPKIQISNSFCHITAWHCEIWLTWTQSLKSHVRFQKEDCCWKESLLCVTNIVKKLCRFKASYYSFRKPTHYVYKTLKKSHFLKTLRAKWATLAKKKHHQLSHFGREISNSKSKYVCTCFPSPSLS